MSKGRGRRSDNGRSSEVSFTTSNQRLPRPVTFSAPDPGSWHLIEDRREFFPDPLHRPAAAWTGGSPAVRVSKTRSGRFLPFGLSFSQPKTVMICLRRKARKEVLHALGFTGRGHGGGKKRRNYYSKIRC